MSHKPKRSGSAIPRQQRPISLKTLSRARCSRFLRRCVIMLRLCATVQFRWRFVEIFKKRGAQPALNAEPRAAIQLPPASSRLHCNLTVCPGNGVAENSNRKPCSALGIDATSRSIMISMPATNGSWESPTAGSSQTHIPSYLHGTMTPIACVRSIRSTLSFGTRRSTV
jgi:hypothetical protein